MHKDVATGIANDEAEPLRRIKPLDDTPFPVASGARLFRAGVPVSEPVSYAPRSHPCNRECRSETGNKGEYEQPQVVSGEQPKGDSSADRRRKGSNNNGGREKNDRRLHDNQRVGEDVSSYDSAGQVCAGRGASPDPAGRLGQGDGYRPIGAERDAIPGLVSRKGHGAS